VATKKEQQGPGTGNVSTDTGHTFGADDRYLFGTPAEGEGRLADGRGYAPTESHFTQIRPETASPRGRNINEQVGTTRDNRAKVTHRGGRGG